MSYTIIIPTKNPTNLVACIKAIRDSGDLSQIVIVDDGVNPEELDAFNIDARARFVQGKKPFCFARNINRGIKAAGVDDDVVLLNDDALLEEGSFRALALASQNNPKYAVLAAAVTGYANYCWPLAPFLRAEFAATYHMRDRRSVPFVAVYIPRSALNIVGPLDERFCGFAPIAPIVCPQCGWGHRGLHEDGTPIPMSRPPEFFRCGQCGNPFHVAIEEGYGGEDRDYCYRARKAGLNVGVYDGCVVDHEKLQSTFRPDGRGRSVAAARMRFYQIHQVAMEEA